MTEDKDYGSLRSQRLGVEAFEVAAFKPLWRYVVVPAHGRLPGIPFYGRKACVACAAVLAASGSMTVPLLVFRRSGWRSLSLIQKVAPAE